MQQISLLKKIATCFIAGIIASFAVQRIVYRTIWEFKNKWIPPPIFVAIPVLLTLLIVIIYAFYWNGKERNGQTNSTSILAFWQGVIRYFIAIDLSMIGWQKIFHLQFYTPLGILDQPFSSFSGESLTWAYFKRSSLFGCFILFPVLLNIAFIDFFYHFEAGELGHVIILLAATVYLLLLDYDRLKEFFFSAKNNLFAFRFKNRLLPAFIRISAVLIPVLLILSYNTADKNPQFTGKYKVTDLFINQKPITAISCQDSVLSTVYFDKGNEIVFEFNSQQRRLIGSYQFNKDNNHFNATWRFPLNQSAFEGMLSTNKQNQITLVGKIGSDSLKAILLKSE